jgi:hypothetical protein
MKKETPPQIVVKEGVGEVYGYALLGKNGRAVRRKLFASSFSISTADTLTIYDGVGTAKARGTCFVERLDKVTEALKELRKDIYEIRSISPLHMEISRRFKK